MCAFRCNALTVLAKNSAEDTGGSGEPGTIKEQTSPKFSEEEQPLDLEVTHSGDAEHSNSGESATIKKRLSFKIKVICSRDIEYGNSGKSHIVTNGPAGSSDSVLGECRPIKSGALSLKMVRQLHMRI